MPAKLVSRIPEIIAELPVRSAEGSNAAAGVIAREASSRAPRLRVAIDFPSFRRYPGELANSINAHPSAAGGGQVDVGAYWGGFVERGTRYMRAEPYLGPAVEYGEPEAVAAEEAAFSDL